MIRDFEFSNVPICDFVTGRITFYATAARNVAVYHTGNWKFRIIRFTRSTPSQLEIPKVDNNNSIPRMSDEEPNRESNFLVADGFPNNRISEFVTSTVGLFWK